MTGIQVDYRDRRPIYEQLVTNIRSLVLRGMLAPDEQLPSVRALAADLGIIPIPSRRLMRNWSGRG